jgi:hypothetical protein
MMLPDDHLVIITVRESDIMCDKITSQVNSVCVECNIPTPTFVCLTRENGQNVYKTIQQYLIHESN